MNFFCIVYHRKRLKRFACDEHGRVVCSEKCPKYVFQDIDIESFIEMKKVDTKWFLIFSNKHNRMSECILFGQSDEIVYVPNDDIKSIAICLDNMWVETHHGLPPEEHYRPKRHLVVDFHLHKFFDTEKSEEISRHNSLAVLRIEIAATNTEKEEKFKKFFNQFSKHEFRHTQEKLKSVD